MKKFIFYPITVTLLALFPALAFSQFNVKITVNSGSATTTCLDIGLPAFNPMWSLRADNGNWVDFPGVGACLNPLPYSLYDQSFLCFADAPPTIPICFRAFDNDGNVFNPCDIQPDCIVEACIDVPVPAQGAQTITLDLPDGFAADGQSSITISTSGFPGGVNDAICNAIDVGVLPNNTTLGDADQSLFHNYCATNTNEPEPSNWGTTWINSWAVWFKFTTNSDPGPYVEVLTKSDPSGVGDPLNLQLAVFTSSDQTCTGTMTMVAANYTLPNYNENVLLVCPQPNTTYYVMVDGSTAGPGQGEGYYGIEINALDVQRGGDLRCDAENLGAVPPGGSLTSGLRTNSCATSPGDPTVPAFLVQKGVWFAFNPPPTGHVLIEATSDTQYDPIGLQLALFTSSDNTCSGTMTLYQSAFVATSNDETMELHCTDPNQTFFLLVDGSSGNLISGIFDITISDAGDETVFTVTDTALCAGTSITVGTSTYTLPGTYTDTFTLPSGCDSVVTTNVTVLTPVEIDIAVIQQGLGPGNDNGIAEASANGGAGNYSFLWSDAQTTAQGINLLGGDTYCVTATDGNGCTADTCFEMPYYLHFVPQLTGDTVLCNGDGNGVVSLTAALGAAPYQFTWQNEDDSMNGSGVIPADNQLVTIPNLPAGIYTIRIVDIWHDTIVTVEILEPAPLEIVSFSLNDAACFNECNGDIALTAGGGTPPYQFDWSNGSTATAIQNLCAGNYSVVVTDANGCTATFDYTLGEPAEFLATAMQTREVSCFGGSDGAVEVTTNGNPIAWAWSNGAVNQSVTGLPGGAYVVTVTNANGCTATATATVQTPAEPVGVNITQTTDILCNGDKNGVLEAKTTGPGVSFSYNWSNGSLTSIAPNLGAGSYSVTITSNKGCTATASYFLTEPTPLVATATGNQLSCLDAPDDGVITVETVSGGVAPYTYSNDGFNFSEDMILDGFPAGSNTYYIKDAGGCVKPFQSTVIGPKEINLEVGENQTIELGEEVFLNALVNVPTGSVRWEPAGLVACDTCLQTSLQPIENVRLKLTITDEFGCQATDELAISVLKKRRVYVPNAFSPDGDGLNDEFVPFGGEDVLEIKNFKIFDRQGNLVFSAENLSPGNLSKGWNGEFRGRIMQPGVFVWFAEIVFIDKVQEIYSGDVTLLR
jgi:gliding motility-associated-like protein